MKSYQYSQFYAWEDLATYDLTDLLDTFGAKGWELVNYHVFEVPVPPILDGKTATHSMLIFKREYEDQKMPVPFKHWNNYLKFRKAELGADWKCPKAGI